MTGHTNNDGLFDDALEAPTAPGDGAGPPGSGGAEADSVTEVAGGELDALHVYLREVQRRPTISPDRTRRCCRAMHDAEDAAPPEAASNGSAGEAYKANRDEMVEGNLDLVVRIARQYERYRVPLEDLIQEGNVGLLAAVDRFDPDRGVPFPAYATGWIRQAICRAISVKSRTIRIPLDVLGLRRRAASVLSELEQAAHNRCCRTGHYEAPTVADCAHEIGVSTNRLRTTMRRVPEVDSLDAPAVRARRPLISSLADSRQQDPMTAATIEERRAFLEAALICLPERVRYVMRRHYGFGDDRAASFSQIGREMHISSERARQLHARGLRRLRDAPRLRAATS